MKQCSKCKQELSASMFGVDRHNKDGLCYACKRCKVLYTRNWQDANPERAKEINRNWYKNNPEKRRAKNREWHKNNKNISLECDRRYMQNPENKEKIRAAWRKNYALHPERWAARRAAKNRAIPAWVNRDAVRDIYLLALEVSASTGIPHHVDHIVPLRSKIVCGLHVESNLQVVSSTDNLKKSNLYWPEMP